MILLIFFVLGTIVMMFLPETLHQKLPETLRDAEKFGKTQPFWYIPKPVHHNEAKDNGDINNTKDRDLLEKLNQPQFTT